MSEEKTSPKVFLSYCWTSPDFQQIVINFATRLRSDGVDVILDAWNLKEGQDATTYMEEMVNNDQIEKVIIYCNKEYANKADKKLGGVGVESQIISEKVYKDVKQVKFVAIVLDKDDNGNAILPTYLKSRYYIDFSDSTGYEQLIRWINDKPLHPKPPLGSTPSYITNDNKLSMNTSSKYQDAMTSITETLPKAKGKLKEYLELFANNLAIFRVDVQKRDIESIEKVCNSTKETITYRNEFLSLLNSALVYEYPNDIDKMYHRFFEQTLGYFSSNLYDDNIPNDSICTLIHELFICTIAMLLKHERFVDANSILSESYFIESENRRNNRVNYSQFFHSSNVLTEKNKLLDTKLLDPQATLLKERANTYDRLKFNDIMLADLVIYVRNVIDELKGRDTFWYPITLLYSAYIYNYPAFRLFEQCNSSKYFDRVKPLLDVQSKNELFEAFGPGKKDAIIRVSHEAIDIGKLLNLQKIATKD